MSELGDALMKMEERWDEIDLMIDISSKLKSDKQKNIINGSLIILSVAHFEALLMEICEGIVNDVNKVGNFHKLPQVFIEKYVRNFIDLGDARLNSKEGNIRVSRVVKWISQEKLIIDLKDYVSTGGNPTPDRITRIAKSLGVDDLFARISTTPIDYAFSTSSAINFRAETMRVKTYLKRYTQN